MRMAIDELVQRARDAERLGFDGVALMDHLAPPGATEAPMYEAITTAAWLAARTERLTVGHLVLCDAFRHPALLAKQAVTLAHASGGRFELGLGWGSVPDEIEAFGVADTAPAVRVARMAETLEVVRGLWSGEPVSFEGAHHRLGGVAQQPVPERPIPIVIGGIGRRTLALVAAHADWWNLPLHTLDRLDELRPRAGRARVSIQQMVTLVPSEAVREQVVATARRRFGWMAGESGSADPRIFISAEWDDEVLPDEIFRPKILRLAIYNSVIETVSGLYQVLLEAT
jgi:alkanesulfonate monooxygenase SsuD/methylene tetrahydromethanopterin reductase-like flavin-dependent oxidoreductase (luciferase family)